MSNGNAEQPTAQAPRGHSSPNRVEVSEEGRQGAPRLECSAARRARTAGAKNSREEQLAKAPAGAADRPGCRGGGPTCPSLLGLPPARSRPLVRAREGLRGTPPIHQKQQPAQQTPQKQAPQPSTQQKQGPSPTTKPQQVQSPPSQPRPQPQTGGQAASASAQKQPRPSPPSPGAPDARPASGAVPVWDPPPPPAPKEGLWTRLGFGRKAERPEGNAAAPPAQQPRVPPTQPAPTTPEWGDRRAVRPLRAGSTGRRCSRLDAAGSDPGARPAAPGAWKLSPGAPSVRALQRLRVWRPQHPPRFVRRRRPGSLAHRPGTRTPRRADRPYARCPGRSTCFTSRPSFRTASARAHRTGRSSHADAGAADAACRSDCNPGTGPGVKDTPHEKPARRRRSGRRGA